MMKKTSQAKFHELTIPERREMLQKWSDLDDETLDDLVRNPGVDIRSGRWDDRKCRRVV